MAGYWWTKAHARLMVDAELRALLADYGELPQQDEEFWMWLATATIEQIRTGM